MKIKNPFSDLTKFELALWFTSVMSITVSFLMSGNKDWLTVTSSLIGVTALIFIAKGYVIGQILLIVFSVFYGIVSFFFSYYGEMITYLGMSAPAAVAAVISWMKHPYKDTKEVEISRLTKKQLIIGILSTVAVTAVFYFILGALNNASLAVSTLSVTTSFIAAYLTYYRSPYYAIGYAANDLVLIVLWIIATIESISYLPMVICFIMFFANDIYGFISWKKMQKRQSA
ncbi:MAG: nicotinamide mononucleotide transporter [Ruminococcaceae bacterium]|nr:nicotinamide mononucleotide transporter [Oscillospiraceae bacterium]